MKPMPYMLPFLPEFEDAIRSGRKIATTRRRKFGDPGDDLTTPFGDVRILNVQRVTLAEVAARFWREEGASSPADFRSVWEHIHPRTGWVPDQKVWLHHFELRSADR